MARYRIEAPEGSVFTVSSGNMKVKVPNSSGYPVRDCGANCTYCARDCYALQAVSAYPTAKAAWDRNSGAMRDGRGRTEAFYDIAAYLRRSRCSFFRIHVSGDFLDQDHLDRYGWLANAFNGVTSATQRLVRFLAFTKRDDLSYRNVPANLRIVASLWPGMPDRFPAHLPRAYMQDGTETRVPSNALHCPGQCDGCMHCWHLAPGRSVVFAKH